MVTENSAQDGRQSDDQALILYCVRRYWKYSISYCDKDFQALEAKQCKDSSKSPSRRNSIIKRNVL